MLPYPSGKLHMGHVRNYTINDVMYRHLRMKGCNVLMPMGWDAFGLPAENAAMKNGVPPAKWTYDNIAYMKKQCQAMGWAIDWSREVATCDPAYYRWNQWFFLRMLEKGIAYKKTGVVNWDPVDQTVLANEQVIDGRGWRTGALVEKREIPMYYLRITDYAEELLAYLDKMPGWPERVKPMQANWIGKSVGVRFAFPHDIRDDDGQADRRRPDVRLHHARRHDHGRHVLRGRRRASARRARGEDESRARRVHRRVQARQRASKPTSRRWRRRACPPGSVVTHPLTGEKIEVWVGNYVLMGYGEGAVMGVPAHDERDFAFAKKYGLPIKQVIAVDGEAYSDRRVAAVVRRQDARPLRQLRQVRRPRLRGSGRRDRRRPRRDGPRREADHVPPARLGHLAPALLGHADPDHPLPEVRRRARAGRGSAGRAARGLRARRHRQSAREARRFRRDEVPEVRQPGEARDRHDGHVRRLVLVLHALRVPATRPSDGRCARNDYWMPMDQYIGGIEHAILHLLYARFWTKVMRDMGLVKIDEPFTRLLTQGMVLNHIYFRRTDEGRHRVLRAGRGRRRRTTPRATSSARSCKADGQPVEYGGIGTMSKSKNNGVDPQDMIDRYGADTARLFVMFAAPPEATLDGPTPASKARTGSCAAVGVRADARGRRDRRAADAFDERDAGAAVKAARREIHLALKQANYDYERIQYNTVVSAA